MITEDRKELLLQEYINCYNDIIYFAKNYCYIQHPTEGKILFDLYPFQENVVKLFPNHKKVIINKSRQIGLSTLIGMYVAWTMIFNENKNVVVIATKRDTAKEIVDKVKLIYYNLPLFLSKRKNDKELATTDNAYEFKLKNGSKIKAFSASPDATRSQAASIVVFDEMAFTPKCEAIYTALLPVIDAGGQMISLSTPNGTNNLFYELWQGAESGENGFLPIKLKWDVHPKRDLVWRRKQDDEFGVQRARQEFDTDFLLTGNTVIDPEKLLFIEKSFIQEPIGKRGEQQDYWMWKNVDYSHTYMVIVDTAQGTSDDNHSIQVIDLLTFEQVAEYKGKIDFKDLPQLSISIAAEWNNALLIAENTGIGWSTANSIAHSYYPQEKIYKKLKGNNDYNLNLDQYSNKFNDSNNFEIGFSMNTASRPLIISTLISSIQTNSLIIRSSRTLGELRTFIYLNGKPQAAQGTHDDCIMPLGIGCFLRDTALLQRDKMVDYSRELINNVSVYRPNSFSNNYQEIYKQQNIFNVGDQQYDTKWLL
jgi:hypothetical protein